MKLSKIIFHNIILLCLCTLIISNVYSKEYKLNSEHNKRLKQAKSLRKSGLIEESKHVYKNLLNDYPYLKEALDPLKLILKNKEDWGSLNEIANNYVKANNFSFQSKAEIFEIFLWSQNIEWKLILKEILNNIENEKSIKLIFNALLNNDKVNELLENLTLVRDKKSADYFAFHLGNYYSINLSIDKAINEFMLYLEHNPNQKTLVRNRIMAFPDIPSIQLQIRDILNQSNSINAKLILADLEFKEKKYKKAYELIKKYSQDDNEKINFIKNLIRLKEYDLSQLLINDILDSITDEKILKKALIQSAKIFEKLLISNIYNLPISNNIVRNELLNSQYLKVNEKNSIFLSKAIAIYDSLSINSYDNEAPFYLAEIKYRIQGDLDGAKLIYQSILDNKRSNKFKVESMNRLIDIMISKGDLEYALKKVNSLKEIQTNDKVVELLNVKMIQILFYQNNFEDLNILIEDFLKDSKKNNKFYNDILKLKSNLLLFFDNNDELKKYSLSMFKIYQNKRIEAINILNNLSKIENTQIAEKILYESAYLNLLQGNIEESLKLLSKISQESPYIESKLLLEAEIYDYLLQDISKAVEIYLHFLDMFPDSIYYDIIRLRLRGLTS